MTNTPIPVIPSKEYVAFESFIAERLTLIYSQHTKLKEEEQDILLDSEKEMRKKLVQNTLNELVAGLYVIMRSVQIKNPDDPMAAKMQEIVDIVSTQDLAQPLTRNKVLTKRSELNGIVLEAARATRAQSRLFTETAG